MVYSIGLTGGIASGKSTVAKMFAQLGIQVISADVIAKKLTTKGQYAYQKILARYGEGILDPHKELERKNLRHIIFSQPQERLWLEQLLHPLIRAQIKNEVDNCVTPYCLVEIPLLVDKENYSYLNRILLVKASAEIQLARLMRRDQSSQEQALDILGAQPDMELRLKHADDVLSNEGDIMQLESAVKNLHQLYLQKAKLISGSSSHK